MTDGMEMFSRNVKSLEELEEMGIDDEAVGVYTVTLKTQSGGHIAAFSIPLSFSQVKNVSPGPTVEWQMLKPEQVEGSDISGPGETRNQRDGAMLRALSKILGAAERVERECIDQNCGCKNKPEPPPMTGLYL